LNPGEYGKIATYKGNEINIQFYKSFDPASPFEVNIETSRVWAVARTSDVSDAIHGDTLTIDGTVYKIMGPPEPGDSGLTTLKLSL
jgi:hypothetical protein